jgi:hypothetical protein
MNERTDCTLCDEAKVPNGGYLLCPHCDQACRASTINRRCTTCELIDKRTRP